ncbi:protein-tyrosine phosphatase-like protein [Gymnopilus junonius]|uniref:Protein-tyrosine phosphatase-like protein n=1 Tax=Gymnopilus junonius TaxID=109634 RepID=A0A9P5NLW2_GYMJU|nr:protein-tyrosine phosphatase-like protein [Gymnopilus junonius]
MVDSEERLAVLASQHHVSAFNRARFGPQGSPVRYLPLSLHLPEQFNQLRQRQLLLTAELSSWWPSQPSIPVPSLSLQDEIMAAMSEPLCPTSPTLKTSLSHPINISMVIPPDLVALISSHALLSSSRYTPTVLEIPPSFTLHRLSSLRIPRVSHFQSNTPVPALPVFSSLTTQTNSTHFRTRSNVTDALQAAISTDIEKQPSEYLKNTVMSSFTSDSSISLSSLSFSVTMSSPVVLQPANQSVSAAMPIASILKIPSARSELGQAFRSQQSTATTSSFLIGNLFLSSCPGKKVRLNGPVKGRRGVCRDLETDMKKIKDLRVGCVVCCLDDSELEFLGAPWPEYECTAKKFGIDILRVPPISPSCLDVHLVNLINQYSLQGIPVLVHCRGGVGRAGVVACCWMIRLGLCGWLDSEGTDQDTSADEKALEFVEKAIAFIRTRRSVKAVETYEQVKFLNDYVRYLYQGFRTSLD